MYSNRRALGAGGRKPLLRQGGGSTRSYSPDGTQIAFTSSFEGNAEIYVIGAGGGTPRRLTKSRSIDNSPTWAPNSQQIAFTSDRGGSPQVYVMDADGGNVRRLVYGLAYTDSPDWSPKGDRIAFVSRSGGGFDIYVVDLNGQDPRQVVTGGSNLSPRWAPDGRHLVFSSDRGGKRGLYVVDADGTRTRSLNITDPEAKTPAWSTPDAGRHGRQGSRVRFGGPRTVGGRGFHESIPKRCALGRAGLDGSRSGRGLFKRAAQAPPATEPPPATQPVESTPPPPVEQPKEPSEPVTASWQDAYYDYDSYDLREDARGALDADAKMLADHANASLTIEGHCDERGTPEYNLALGERRANAAKDYLVAHGVNGSRIETISYGEERPFATGHDEASWAQNRRAHLVQK